MFCVLIQIGARVYSESDLQTLSSHMKKEIDDEVNRILEVRTFAYIEKRQINFVYQKKKQIKDILKLFSQSSEIREEDQFAYIKKKKD